MRPFTLVLAGSLACAAIQAGCASPQPARQNRGQRQDGPTPSGELLSSRPAAPTPDLSALESYVAPAFDVKASGPYRSLKPHDAQCAAARQCPKANALSDESRIVAAQSGKHHASQRSAAVVSKALEYRAADERNRAAAQALELFYLLAEAEASRDILARSQTQIGAMLEEVRDIESRGIRVEKGTAEMRRQQLELLERQSELQLSLAQATSRLRQLMGLSFEETAMLWPEADWKVTVEPTNVNAVVSDGLYRRADLNMLRMLIQCLDADSLNGVRSSESAITGMVGVSRAAACLLPLNSGEEVSNRRCQLADLLARQELAAAEEIRQAALAVEIRLQQVSVAKLKVEHFRDQLQVQRLSRERPGSAVTSLDIAAADLKLLDAQRELAHQVMAWRIAQVKLREAQGVLVFECCDCR